MKNQLLAMIFAWFGLATWAQSTLTPDRIWSFDNSVQKKSIQLLKPSKKEKKFLAELETSYQEYRIIQQMVESQRMMENPEIQANMTEKENVSFGISKEKMPFAALVNNQRWIVMPQKIISSRFKDETEALTFGISNLFAFSAHYLQLNATDNYVRQVAQIDSVIGRLSSYPIEVNNAIGLSAERVEAYNKGVSAAKLETDQRISADSMAMYMEMYQEEQRALRENDSIARTIYQDEARIAIAKDSITRYRMHPPEDLPEYQTKAETLPKTSVRFEEEEYDFKEIKEGAVTEHSFKLVNTGTEPLIITHVKPSCGCTASYCDKESVAPGESCQIVVQFNSKGRPGSVQKTVSVFGNFEGIRHELKFKGEVIPQDDKNKDGKRKKKKN